MRYLWVLIVVGLFGGWHWWAQERPLWHAAGTLITAEPDQRDLDAPRQWSDRGYTFVARAHYDISARILRKENYYVDGEASLAPVDLAVGWGPMSDSAVIDQLALSQMGRFFYWQPKSKTGFPIPSEMLITHAAQMHMIPATRDVERRLRKLRPGELVTMAGYLVDVRGPGGFVWNTSLTRNDTGDGACEIFWAESIEIQ